MFNSRTILVVEDEPLIALDLAEAIEEFGGVVAGPVPSVSEGMELLGHQAIDGAILDSILIDRDAAPIALHLVRAGIPLVFHSGTGLPPEVAQVYPDLPLLFKPTDAASVAARLWAEIQKHSAR